MEPRKPYPTDLSDKEWDLIKHLVPEAKPGGRPEKYPKHEIMDAIFYILRGGCAWRLLPHDFPPLADCLTVLLALAARRDLAAHA
jgi:transposase